MAYMLRMFMFLPVFLLLVDCNSPVDSFSPQNTYAVYLKEPKGGESISINDTLRFVLIADTTQPLQLIWIGLTDEPEKKNSVHITHFSDISMYNDGFFFLSDSVITGDKVEMNIGWKIPESIIFWPDTVELTGRKLSISCHHFKVLNKDEIFKVKDPITILH